MKTFLLNYEDEHVIIKVDLHYFTWLCLCVSFKKHAWKLKKKKNLWLYLVECGGETMGFLVGYYIYSEKFGFGSG